MLWLALGIRLSGVSKIAVTVQNTAPLDAKNLRNWHKLLKWFQRLGVISVPCTNAVVQSLKPIPKNLTIGNVIPNGCNTRLISERSANSRRKRKVNDFFRILMVARLDPIKDQTTLLKAFSKVKIDGWQLQLIGEGSTRKKLETLADSLGLAPKDVLVGERYDIPELLGQSDIFAFSTTRNEGFGIVLLTIFQLQD